MQTFNFRGLFSRTPKQSESINSGLTITILYRWNEAKNVEMYLSYNLSIWLAYY